MNELDLKIKANEIRKGIVTAVHSAKAGHPGGSLSAADIMTYLYFEEMNVDPANPKKADRDRFVLSEPAVTLNTNLKYEFFGKSPVGGAKVYVVLAVVPEALRVVLLVKSEFVE